MSYISTVIANLLVGLYGPRRDKTCLWGSSQQISMYLFLDKPKWPKIYTVVFLFKCSVILTRMLITSTFIDSIGVYFIIQTDIV